MAFSGFRQESISCSLAEIDFTDRQYPFSYGRDDGRLRQSVVREGVVQPPLLAAGAAGLVIVCGRRRLEALRQVRGTAAGKIEAWLAVDADPAALCLHALWENAGHRQFNPVEAADIFTVLEKLLPAAALGDEILGVLGLPPKAKFLRRCRVIAAMEDEVRRRLAAGLLDGETVDLLADWLAADRRELLALAEELTLNRNRLREITRLAADLAGRDGETPAAVLRRTREALSASWPVTGGEFHQRL
ncbi:MAG: hypothetical protein JRJ56_09155, partial [Deltaproteobacteria bacterium]|nr:hypothetical protein [Deltaproteobacteria bacterium]